MGAEDKALHKVFTDYEMIFFSVLPIIASTDFMGIQSHLECQ